MLKQTNLLYVLFVGHLWLMIIYSYDLVLCFQVAWYSLFWNCGCRRFIRRCKQGCLQFVILKPILVAVTLILYAKGKYNDGNFSPKQAYLYLTIIYTISYTMALYALALFYFACRDLLQPFNPVPKFIIIKSVVFLTYWQVKFSPSLCIMLGEILCMISSFIVVQC